MDMSFLCCIARNALIRFARSVQEQTIIVENLMRISWQAQNYKEGAIANEFRLSSPHSIGLKEAHILRITEITSKAIAIFMNPEEDREFSWEVTLLTSQNDAALRIFNTISEQLEEKNLNLFPWRLQREPNRGTTVIFEILPLAILPQELFSESDSEEEEQIEGRAVSPRR